MAHNAFRFAALGKIAAAIGRGLAPGFVPDVVHGHDWQSGLAAAYLYYSDEARPGTVVTVHNLAYQGQFPATLLGALELPQEALTFSGIEHYGAIGYLKAALQLSDRITTVSPTYAMEIQRPETGMGFDGLLRERSSRLRGIFNGIDTDVWNPADDPRIAVNYDAKTLYARALNKEELQRALGLNLEPDTLVAGIISRLSCRRVSTSSSTICRFSLKKGCNSRCLAKATRRSKPGSARPPKASQAGWHLHWL